MTRHYEKGDDKAGGGGSKGGGGKRGRPPDQDWEKGDVVRGVAAARPEVEMPRKPGRQVPGQPERGAPEPETPGSGSSESGRS
jgi:hypothetical protein